MGDGRELDLNGRRKGLRSALALDVEGWVPVGMCYTRELQSQGPKADGAASGSI